MTVPSLLAIAVSGAAYYLSERAPIDPLVIGWLVERHPCDDEPYLAGLDFSNEDHNTLPV